MLSQQLREALAASGKERIRDLVKNPLRCSLLCGTWPSLDGDLPDTKAKLYRWFVTTLYQWKKPRLNWIQQQELNTTLGKLALSGMLNETSRFQLPESVGYRVMGEFHFELACHVGWLNLVARDDSTRRQAAHSLGEIDKDNPVAIVAVSGLKDCLNSEIYENDFNSYEIC